MSASRRSGADVNILAMLDRHASRPRGKRWLALPLPVWYGAAGVLACCLLAGLAWAMRDADGDDGGAHDAVAALPAPLTVSVPVTPPQPEAAPAPAGAMLAVSAPAAHPVGQSVPPASSSHHPRERSADDATPKRAPVHAPAAVPKPHPTAPKARVPAHASHHPARQETARARTVAGNPKGTPGAKPAVDNDVALISAIIQHVNSHGQAADDGPHPPAGRADDAKKP